MGSILPHFSSQFLMWRWEGLTERKPANYSPRPSSRTEECLSLTLSLSANELCKRERIIWPHPQARSFLHKVRVRGSPSHNAWQHGNVSIWVTDLQCLILSLPPFLPYPSFPTVLNDMFLFLPYDVSNGNFSDHFSFSHWNKFQGSSLILIPYLFTSSLLTTPLKLFF